MESHDACPEYSARRRCLKLDPCAADSRYIRGALSADDSLMANDIQANNPQKETAEDSRADQRVPGPFDGRWVGALTLPLRIHDLSEGGCLIQAYHDQAPGQRFTLEIELPYEGWISVEAETLYIRGGYGFAVKFIDIPSDTQEKLARVIHRLATKKPSDR